MQKIQQGKIIAIEEPKQGISRTSGNQWRSQNVTVQYGNPDFPETMVLKAFNSPLIGQFAAGQGISCDAYAHAHEYNGRWYNEISMKNEQVTSVAGQTVPPQQSQPQQTQPQQAQSNDLPY